METSKFAGQSMNMGIGHNYDSIRAQTALASGMAEAAKPLTPVQGHLQRQRELLSELAGAASGLIDPLRSALSHDPRESKGLVGSGSTEPGNPMPGCDLEEAVMNANLQISGSIDMLRQIRSAIRL